MLNARVLQRRLTANTEQLVDHTTVEHHHQHEWYARVNTQMDIVPHRIDTVLRGLRIDAAIRFVEAGEEKDVQVECNEHGYDASDDCENALGCIEPCPSEATEHDVSIDGDENKQPCRRLRRSVADEGDELARRYGVSKKSERVDVREVMVEVPSVEHEDVKDGNGAHVVHGRLLLRVPEGRPAEDGEREQVKNSANNDEK